MERLFYGYNYSVISAVALGVHLIINWKHLFGWRRDKSRGGEREFSVFLAAISAFFLCDIAWGVLAGQKLIFALYVNTVLFFVLLASSVFCWVRFVVAYLGMRGKAGKSLTWAGRIILGTFLVSLVINHFTGMFFRIEEGTIYSGGALRIMQLIILMALAIYSSALTFRAFIHTQGALRRRNLMVAVFGCTMLAALLLQLEYPLLPFYALGHLFGCCFLHIFVFEDERDEIYQKKMLARDYAAKLEAERAANTAKSLFFSSVSHDIRTPLNAILGFSELLEQGVADERERKRFIASIGSSGKVLARLIDDVLDLSKLEIGKLEIVPESTDMPALVREVIDACEVARSHKSLALETSIDDMPRVNVDPHRIRQILFNLLSNAYKYTLHGTISVSVRWRGEDGSLAFCVADTGVGISEENMERILQPFVQIVDKNNRNGTGLGLPICKKLAELMGGELSIESKVGVGSKFTVTLHDVKTVEPVAPHHERPVCPVLRGMSPLETSAHILVVDDSPVNRAVLKAMLNKCGATNVEFAEDGQVAFDILKKDSHFDLILTDLWMPKMDGYALIRAIRNDQKLSRLPVYLITADVEVFNNDMARAFTNVLFKPISLQTLKAFFR